jgi:hypothetical protein
MAHTDIALHQANGVFVPSQSQVSVVEGDTIAFSINDGSQVAIFFSPGAAAALSPSPAVPTMLGSGNNAEFTFTTSDAGAYSVFFEKAISSRPVHYPLRESNLLLLQIETSGIGFSSPFTGTLSGS